MDGLKSSGLDQLRKDASPDNDDPDLDVEDDPRHGLAVGEEQKQSEQLAAAQYNLDDDSDGDGVNKIMQG